MTNNNLEQRRSDGRRVGRKGGEEEAKAQRTREGRKAR